MDPNSDKQGGKNYKPFAKGTFKLAANDTLNVGFNNNMFCCGATASRTAPLITQQVEHGHNPVITSQYTHMFGSKTLLEVRGGGIYIRDNFTPYSDDFTTPGRTDQATGYLERQRPDRFQAVSQPDHSRRLACAQSSSDFLTGSHDFKFGVQTAYATQRSVSIRFGDVSYTDRNAAPYLAIFSTPAATGGRIRSFGTYAQDNWSVNGRLTVNLGLRYDRILGDIPALSASATLDGINGDAQYEVNDPTEYPAVPDLITFNTFAPRAGLTLRLDQSGKTVFKANYGRFYGKLATGMYNSMSPGATPTTTLRFNAATGKYDIPFSFVDNKINFGVNSDLNNQYTDQVFIGIERQLAANMGVNVSFVWKDEANFIRLKDVRGTYAPRDIVDTFSGVSKTITVSNLTSTQLQRLFQVINRDDLDQSFKSAVFEVNKRFSDDWQSVASYTWQDSKAYGGGSVSGSTQQDFSSLSSTAGYGRDPNDLVNAFGPTATNSTHSVKLSSTYRAPMDFNLGVRYSYESGRPYGRLIIVPGLGQGNVTMLAEARGAYALPAVNDLQLRVDKDFRIAGAQRLRLSFDVFNIFNTDTALTLRNNSSQVTATTPWAQTLTVVRPRTVQFGIRYQF